jgi:hypothetical protein
MIRKGVKGLTPPCSPWGRRLRSRLVLIFVFTTSAASGWFGADWRDHAAAAQTTEWKTGHEFRQTLETPLGLQWSENPAREALRNLARNQRVAIWLDRRFDPGTRLNLAIQDMTLGVTLDNLCEKYRLGRSAVSSVVYLGPRGTTEKLATLAAIKRQEVGRQSAQESLRWSRNVAWSVPPLSQPRELVLQLAQEAGATVVNPEAVPFDLWPAIELPPLSLADRLSLVLAGFDLTFEVSADGAQLRIVPMPEQVTHEATYSWGGSSDSLAAQLAKKFPDMQVRKDGNKVLVAGRYENHELIERLLSGETVRTAKVVPGDKRFSLRVDNQPAGAILKTVAKELGKELKYDPALLDKLKSTVSFQVKDVKLDELLRQTLDPLELTYELQEASLVIKPAKP